MEDRIEGREEARQKGITGSDYLSSLHTVFLFFDEFKLFRGQASKELESEVLRSVGQILAGGAPLAVVKKYIQNQQTPP